MTAVIPLSDTASFVQSKTTVAVNFDSQQDTFYAGQTVTGQIVLAVGKPIKVAGIYFMLKGKAAVSFADDHVEHKETYLNMPKSFVHSGGTVDAGEHVYPFSFVLPENIPSSHESTHGSIRYKIKAVINMPRWFDLVKVRRFKVICPLDFNKDKFAMRPVKTQTQQTFFCLWSTLGNIDVELSLPAGGAVPGETILVTLEVDNNSKINIRRIQLKLKERMTFKAHQMKKKVTETLAKIELAGAASPGECPIFEREALTIDPALPPSNLAQCQIIDVEYFIEAKLEPSGLRRPFRVRVPIVIGTVPLQTSGLSAQATEGNP